jgi:thiol:disulfide interchange protein DsbC
MTFYKPLAMVALALFVSGTPFAQEAGVKQRLQKNVANFPEIKSISKSPLNGFFEVVTVDLDIFYTDEQANFLIRGELIDLKTKKNITEARLATLTAIPFPSLPFNDAIVLVRGDGKRKIAIFEDPNCGYCKQFEASLQKVDNITVYLFLYPILGANSNEMSKNIWCAKDRAKAWQNWMLKNETPDAATCDTAPLTRNVAFGRKFKITGTPTVIFASGVRVPGMIPADQIEQMLKRDS